jgi:PadR family transcriptional regulator PadR
MDVSAERKRTPRRKRASSSADADDALETTGAVGPGPLASDRDDTGKPVHRGWAPLGGRRRWMEPFILVLLAEGPAHGYAIVGQLEEMGVSGGELDFGAVYRTLRDLEGSGQVTSTWSNERTGPQRRDYALTEVGYAALDEWSAVMRERGRLIAEFDARYLAAVTIRRRAGTGG